ncbi:hypothetical protein U5922_007340 [Aquicoccus sp. G2-2]|uniref:hypothetical protein n=1 Tax=Aquicoccus sp. G2-2 TaxID=3092120 RepID=UPI002ADFF315|nr:hypothetical protein [Aquicoccus sp. G2-2]MEA1113299.1 hypothetical protein [Aquicoccus sp. G2-2]
MKPVFALCLIGLLSGCLAFPPKDITPEMRDDYVTAVASIGCVLRDESDYQPVELQTGLTREQTIDLTKYHLAKGTAEKLPDDAGIRLMTGACA